MKISPLRIAFATLASLAMASSANAAAILSFAQQFNAQTPIVATTSGSTTTLTTTGQGATGAIPPGWIPVLVNIGNQSSAVPAFMSFTTALTSGTAATQTGTTINQDSYTGTIQFNFAAAPTAATNILTVQFTGGVLSGTAGGNSATFSASSPPSTVTFSSAIPELQALIAASTGRNFGLGLSGLTSALAIINNTIAPFNASIGGTFSTSVVPEPSSLVMAGIPALLGLGFVGFRRRSLAS